MSQNAEFNPALHRKERLHAWNRFIETGKLQGHAHRSAASETPRKAAGLLGISRATLHHRLKKMSGGVRPADMKRFTFIST